MTHSHPFDVYLHQTMKAKTLSFYMHVTIGKCISFDFVIRIFIWILKFDTIFKKVRFWKEDKKANRNNVWDWDFLTCLKRLGWRQSALDTSWLAFSQKYSLISYVRLASKQQKFENSRYILHFAKSVPTQNETQDKKHSIANNEALNPTTKEIKTKS